MSPFQSCQECGAPMDGQQRYCINCAARRGDISNPATQYFAVASRNRSRAQAGPVTPQKSEQNGTRAAGVIFFALLPIAVAVGVIIGQGGSDGGSAVDDAALLKALSNDGAATASVPEDATASTSATSTESNGVSQIITSDFSLQKGFAVSIATVPVKGATSETVEKAQSDAEAKGAKDVGVVDPGKFTIEPAPKAGTYLIYSGEFKSRGDATKALAGLKKKFPDAEVVSISSSVDASGAKVLAETDHGTLHEVTNYVPPPEKIESDTQLVNEIASDTGEDYLDSQEQLPDVIVVGGDPEDAPPLPTGAGD